MSSLVTDILLTAGKVEKIDLNAKITDIQKEIAKLKNDVKDFIVDNYIEIVPTLKKDQTLVLQAEKLADDIKELQRRVEDQIKIELSGSTRELKDLSCALQKSSLSLHLSSQLLKLSECLKKVETSKEEKRYVEAAQILCHMTSLLKNPDSDIEMLNIYKCITAEYSRCFAKFKKDMIFLWEQYITWKVFKEADKEVVSLTIDCEFEEIQQLAKALHYVESLKDCLDFLSAKIMKNFVVPIVSYNECSVFVVDEKIFTVESGDEKTKPGYESVLYNLKLLFQFLHQHLNVDIGDKEHLIALLSDTLLVPMSEKLIRDCISNTVPSSSAMMHNFQQVIQEANEFQDYLIQIGFIGEEQLFLSEYTKNVDTLLIDKICQGYLAKASTIAKKDLADSVRHEPQELVEFDDDLLDEYDYKLDRKLSKHTFQLPACRISKSAQEILILGRDILEETCASTDVSSIRLFYTSRNVFELYARTVPEHHKMAIAKKGKEIALFHNNCMYLAHHLLSLGYEYRDRLPCHLQEHNITYIDLTLVYRTIGSEYFLEYMKSQRNIIIDRHRKGLSLLGQTSALPENTEQILLANIEDLECLKPIWMNILPINIYCRAIGCITNSMVEDLVIKVLTVEDIPAKVATQLVTLFNTIAKRTPSIFPDPSTIQRHVSKWSKFLELMKVLEASLIEIEDRWGDGKGPLAQEFTANQVKHLIRALFQNTDRRSTLLSNIK